MEKNEVQDMINLINAHSFIEKRSSDGERQIAEADNYVRVERQKIATQVKAYKEEKISKLKKQAVAVALVFSMAVGTIAFTSAKNTSETMDTYDDYLAWTQENNISVGEDSYALWQRYNIQEQQDDYHQEEVKGGRGSL